MEIATGSSPDDCFYTFLVRPAMESKSLSRIMLFCPRAYRDRDWRRVGEIDSWRSIACEDGMD